MKNLLMILSLIISFNIFAGAGDSSGGGSQSWEQILSNKSYHVKFPMIGITGRHITVNKLCKDDEQFRTKEEIEITEMVDRGGHTQFEVIDIRYLYSPIEYINYRCVDRGRDCDWVEELATHRLEYEVKVYAAPLHLYSTRRVLFTKKYLIEECE